MPGRGERAGASPFAQIAYAESMATRSKVAASLLLGAILAACSRVDQKAPVPSAPACTSNAQCAAGQICTSGKCQDCTSPSCAVATLVTTLPTFVARIAVDGDTLLILTYDPIPTANGGLTLNSPSLYAAPTSGGAPTLLVSGLDPVFYGRGFAWDAENVYVSYQQALQKLPLSGGPPTNIESWNGSLARPLVAIGDDVFITSVMGGTYFYGACIDVGFFNQASHTGNDLGTCAGQFSGADANGVYLYAMDGDQFFRFPATSSVSMLSNGQLLGAAVQEIEDANFDAPDWIYYGTNVTREVGGVSKISSASFAVPLTEGATVGALAADATGVYICSQGVQWLPTSGTAVESIIGEPCGTIAVDAAHVYFDGADSVYSVPKPTSAAPAGDGGG